MNLKQSIQHGEQMLSEYKDILNKIEDIKKNKDDRAALLFLLEIQEMEFKSRLLNVENKLNSLRKDYSFQFEKDSAEANLKINDLINKAMKYVDKEPLGVTKAIFPLVQSYKDNISQEERNNIYFQLKSILSLIKK